MSLVYRCAFCGKRVDPDARSTHRRVVGWEEKRRDGGANAIHLRETTGDYAHGSCVSLATTNRRLHVLPGQQSLLEGSQS